MPTVPEMTNSTDVLSETQKSSYNVQIWNEAFLMVYVAITIATIVKRFYLYDI